MRNIRRLFPRTQPLPEPVRKAVGYFSHNRWRMYYREFRAAGCPIGSGTWVFQPQTICSDNSCSHPI